VTTSSNRQIWQIWARNLHKWGLAEYIASFLEAAGPLNLIVAQLIYMAQPLAFNALPEDHWQALTEMLEDKNKAQGFAALLREVDLQ
jgi:hypothetical protein